jgi:hypothetical protein
MRNARSQSFLRVHQQPDTSMALLIDQSPGIMGVINSFATGVPHVRHLAVCSDTWSSATLLILLTGVEQGHNIVVEAQGSFNLDQHSRPGR